MKIGSRSKTQRQLGFTLIELVVTVSIVAILATVVAPNFRTFILNNRIKSTSNELLSTFQAARSEAIKRQTSVVVCFANGTLSCTSQTPSGWILFQDNDNDWNFTSSDTLLETHTLPSSQISLLSDGGKRVSYSSTGFASVGTGTTPKINSTSIVVCDNRGNATNSGTTSVARGLSINTTGRASITQTTSSIATMITATSSSCS